MTLAGDAAHAMTNHRGKGLNMCFNDAGELVRGLVEVRDGRKGVGEVLGAYGTEVCERGRREVGMSERQSMMMHDWDAFLESLVMRMGNLGRLGKD